MRIFTRPTLPELKRDNGKDVFAILSQRELATLASDVPAKTTERKGCNASNPWYGSKDYDTSVQQIISGDLSGVPASDKLMGKLELSMPVTRKWATRDDVVGGIPNVPVFLAGQPMCMRRRERRFTEQGPLSIFVSLELSAAIDVEDMRKRGSAILALVRLLADKRPVELFACVSIGNYAHASHMLVKIDTMPIDLARAAHILTCPSVTRGIGYGIGRYLMDKHFGEYWGGGWAYGDCDLYRKNARQIYLSVTNPTHEAFYITAAHYNDSCVKQPEQWLKEKLAQYGGIENEAA